MRAAAPPHIKFEISAATTWIGWCHHPYGMSAPPIAEVPDVRGPAPCRECASRDVLPRSRWVCVWP